MNKLVSRNPILRFKEGRKIEKYGLGDAIVNFLSPSGEYITNGKFDFNKWLRSPQTNGTTPGGLKISQLKSFKTPELTGSREAYLNRLQLLGFTAKSTTENGSSAKVKSKVIPKTGKTTKDWDAEYNSFLGNLTENLKAWLALNNVDYSTAEKMQEYIQGKLGQLGQNSLSKFGVDNKWGNESNNAWNLFVSAYIPSVSTSELPLSTPVVEEVPLAGTNNIQNLLMAMLEATKQGILPATGTYRMNPTLSKANRSDIREVIRRATGKGAYDFTGALRKALRLYINGEQYNADDLAAFGNLDIFNAYKPGFYKKQGGSLLPSRNIVTRFKLRKLN